MNKNVQLALVISVFIGIADSVWNGTVLATYLYDLSNESNTFVGIVEAFLGLTQLFVALPIGAFADSKDKKGRTRKVFVTRLACPAIAIAAILCSIVVYALTFTRESAPDEQLLKIGLVGVMMIWGLTESLVMGPFQAVYADSLPTGDRSQYYAYLYAGYIGASSIGPLLSIALFVVWGNSFSARRIAKVLLAGMFLEFLAAPLFLGFRSSALLGVEADSAGEILTDEHSPDSGTRDQKFQKRVSFFGKSIKMSNFVPWTLFIASLASSLGSGMTVKFFPLYFKQVVSLNPIQIQLIYVVVPIGMCMGMALSQKTHRVFGRVQTLICFKAAAIALLICMIFFSHGKAHSAFILIPIYIVRTSLANCTYPIEESILMDFCARDQRARWKSLESIASFGWCGSALIGGIISDRFAYTTTFGITALLQSMSMLILFFLLPVIPRKERDVLLPHQPSCDEQISDPLHRVVVDDDSLAFTTDDASLTNNGTSSTTKFVRSFLRLGDGVSIDSRDSNLASEDSRTTTLLETPLLADDD
mmetsp:Transcript_11248/g.15450  ORF Transcript_11248/g.15450 Transcript_11248/m.15450 type:complete len:532 (-) Transcript_11248:309-1904(-)